MNTFICSLAARLPGGGGWPGAYFPVSTPCASGENARLPIPWRAQAGKTAASGLRHSIEYCGWLEEKGIRPFWPAIAAAASICSAVHSLKPMARTLPDFTARSSAVKVSSSGVSLS